jgi:hypothetical protein
MNFVQACLQADSTPMNARVALALSRVLEPLNTELSEALAERAFDMAFNLGNRSAAYAAPMSEFFRNCGWLETGFQRGLEHADSLRTMPDALWLGEWHADDTGAFETRCSVTRGFEPELGFVPTLEMSQGGGEQQMRTGEAAPSLAEVITAARSLAREYHCEDQAATV